MNEQAIHEIELNLKEAKQFVDAGIALERLRNNRDFKKVFGEGYFKDEAVRLVHLKADPSMQAPEYQAAIVKQMDGIGCVTSYMNMVQHQASMAAKAIEADEEVLEELRSGSAE